jgi:hypothetical protein
MSRLSFWNCGPRGSEDPGLSWDRRAQGQCRPRREQGQEYAKQMTLSVWDLLRFVLGGTFIWFKMHPNECMSRRYTPWDPILTLEPHWIYKIFAHNLCTCHVPSVITVFQVHQGSILLLIKSRALLHVQAQSQCSERLQVQRGDVFFSLSRSKRTSCYMQRALY